MSLRALAWLSIALLVACGHDATLGAQCPQGEASCAAVAGTRAPPIAGVMSQPPPSGGAGGVGGTGAVSGAGGAGGEPQPLPDASTPEQDASLPPPDAATGDCHPTGFNFTPCSPPDGTAGTPQIKAGESYTLRVFGPYSGDMMFQAQGLSNATCGLTVLGMVTLPDQATEATTCIDVTAEDMSLQLGLLSGTDGTVFTTLQGEVCGGCAP